MKPKRMRICGRKTRTAPTPAMTPSTTRLRRAPSPSQVQPSAQEASPPTSVPSMKSMSGVGPREDRHEHRRHHDHEDDRAQDAMRQNPIDAVGVGGRRIDRAFQAAADDAADVAVADGGLETGRRGARGLEHAAGLSKRLPPGLAGPPRSRRCSASPSTSSSARRRSTGAMSATSRRARASASRDLGCHHRVGPDPRRRRRPGPESREGTRTKLRHPLPAMSDRRDHGNAQVGGRASPHRPRCRGGAPCRSCSARRSWEGRASITWVTR